MSQTFATEEQVSLALAAFAYINAECTIPTTALKLKPLAPGWTLQGVANWTAYIDYSDHGRNDRSLTFSGTSPVWTPILIDFQGTIMGGTIHVEVTGKARDDRTGAVDNLKWAGSTAIRGTNPDASQVKSRLSDVSAQVVAYKESRFQQFGSDGLPKFGPPNGFGVMQIDSPGAQPTPAQIWRWKQNCDDGKAILTSAQSTVAQHYRNLTTAHPSLPALSADDLKRAAYQYYNAGNKGFYWVPNADFTGWDKNSPTYTTYGDDAWQIETAVRAGNPPADWGS